MVKHSSRITLSQSALKTNINFIRKKVGAKTKISSVVKANAYGHGIPQFVKMAEHAGIDHFSTASAFEAEQVLANASPASDIMIMGILYDEDIEWAVKNNIEFFVFEYTRLEKTMEVAKKLDKKALIHLEVETGCNRTGLTEKYFEKAANLLKENPDYLEFKGICTHMAGAESLSNQFRIERQMKRYKQYLNKLKKMKLKPEFRHVACSAAIIAYPEAMFDMVRIGILQYGLWPSPEIYNLHLNENSKKKDSPIKRVITWKTDVMDVKEVPKDEFVGYGTAYQAYKDMTIAVIPIGYCNGYSRGLSNRGYVLIHGRKAPIIGVINMNLFMVDVSHIKNVKEGDEVVLIGRQKNNSLSVSSFTNFTNQLNNELLSRLPAAIPRRIVK